MCSYVHANYFIIQYITYTVNVLIKLSINKKDIIFPSVIGRLMNARNQLLCVKEKLIKKLPNKEIIKMGMTIIRES